MLDICKAQSNSIFLGFMCHLTFINLYNTTLPTSHRHILYNKYMKNQEKAQLFLLLSFFIFMHIKLFLFFLFSKIFSIFFTSWKNSFAQTINYYEPMTLQNLYCADANQVYRVHTYTVFFWVHTHLCCASLVPAFCCNFSLSNGAIATVILSKKMTA